MNPIIQPQGGVLGKMARWMMEKAGVEPVISSSSGFLVVGADGTVSEAGEISKAVSGFSPNASWGGESALMHGDRMFAVQGEDVSGLQKQAVDMVKQTGGSLEILSKVCEEGGRSCWARLESVKPGSILDKFDNLPESPARLVAAGIMVNAIDEHPESAPATEGDGVEKAYGEVKPGTKNETPKMMDESNTMKLAEFFRKNPKPKDEQVHALAASMGVLKDEVEEMAYAMLGSLFAGGKSGQKPDEWEPNQEQLKIGMEVEKEHSDCPCVRMKIAKDHLAEFSDYYRPWLENMEEAMKKKTGEDTGKSGVEKAEQNMQSESPKETKSFAGFKVLVENPAGTDRIWMDENNKETGRTKMVCDYGEITGAIGADGDAVDVYLGPDENAENVYIVHQLAKPDLKEWDEDKVFLGFQTAEDAKHAFTVHRSDGDKAIGGMTIMPLSAFKRAIRREDGKTGLTNEIVVGKEDEDLDKAAKGIKFVIAVPKEKK